MNWFTQHRQQWIAETLAVFGFINRDHLVRKFRVSVQQASKDLQQYQHDNPGAVLYNLSAKRYEVKREAR